MITGSLITLAVNICMACISNAEKGQYPLIMSTNNVVSGINYCVPQLFPGCAVQSKLAFTQICLWQVRVMRIDHNHLNRPTMPEFSTPHAMNWNLQQRTGMIGLIRQPYHMNVQVVTRGTPKHYRQQVQCRTTARS